MVLDRLLDWMLVCTLREWFDRPGEPTAPWTVSALADRTGVSRSTLAKRFADLVGEPPLTYLSQWHMTLAADLLSEREAATVAEIAHAVGYSDAFGFSAAFKRIRGVNPSEFRRNGTAASR